MATRLLETGVELTVWNRSEGPAEELQRLGASVAAAPSAAADDAAVSITMLADDAAVQRVVAGPDGLFEGAARGTVVIDMSTVSPDTSRSLAARAPEGVDVLDAPVKGGPAKAAAGELKILVGGPEDAFERAGPILSHLGSSRHLGPNGAGAAAKVLNNYAVITLVSVMAEALALAEALGIERDAALEVLGGTPLAKTVEHQWPRASGASPASFPMRLAAKDLRLAVDAGRRAGRPLPIAEDAVARLDRALEAGLGDEDQARVVSVVIDG
ncbi:MAG TPA: NAD(P)-dependent oxidoreductase [Actinomycetota bacterium]|nr:NAD(P)-dependent oxidoreductase [Actinomycetota bacterium]